MECAESTDQWENIIFSATKSILAIIMIINNNYPLEISDQELCEDLETKIKCDLEIYELIVESNNGKLLYGHITFDYIVRETKSPPIGLIELSW